MSSVMTTEAIQVLFIADAKGYSPMSPLTVVLSTCSCFSSSISCLVASHPESIT